MAEPPGALPTQLIARFGRHVTGVQRSVTGRCRLRCVYFRHLNATGG